jgi:hypothetical protein
MNFLRVGRISSCSFFLKLIKSILHVICNYGFWDEKLGCGDKAFYGVKTPPHCQLTNPQWLPSSRSPIHVSSYSKMWHTRTYLETSYSQSTYGIEYHSVCRHVGIWTPPPSPSPPSEYTLPRNQRGEGHIRLRVWGWGASRFGRLENKPSTLSIYSVVVFISIQ